MGNFRKVKNRRVHYLILKSDSTQARSRFIATKPSWLASLPANWALANLSLPRPPIMEHFY